MGSEETRVAVPERVRGKVRGMRSESRGQALRLRGPQRGGHREDWEESVRSRGKWELAPSGGRLGNRRAKVEAGRPERSDRIF